jgi:PilS N terminal
LLVGSISLVQTVLNTSRANDTITGISRVMAQIDKIWSASPSYADLTLGAAGGAGVFEGMVVGRDANNVVTSVTSKFNRPVTLSLNPALPTDKSNRGYALTFTGIPTGVCADIVTAAASTGLRAIGIIPEATAGQTPGGAPTGLTLSTKDDLNGLDTAGVVVVQPSKANLDIVAMTGTKGCGTTSNTVSLVLANWK